MNKKQSVSDSASAGRPRPYDEDKMRINKQEDLRKADEIEADRYDYIEREIEELEQKLCEVSTKRARAVAFVASKAVAISLLIGRLILQPHNLQQFEGVTHSGISGDESSTITTVDGVDTTEGEEVNQ